MDTARSHKDVSHWEQADHIEDVKSTLGQTTCPAHDALSRATIFTLRKLGDIEREIGESRHDIQRLPERLAHQVGEDRVHNGRGDTLKVLGLTIGVIMYIVGKTKGWW